MNFKNKVILIILVIILILGGLFLIWKFDYFSFKNLNNLEINREKIIDTEQSVFALPKGVNGLLDIGRYNENRYIVADDGFLYKIDYEKGFLTDKLFIHKPLLYVFNDQDRGNILVITKDQPAKVYKINISDFKIEAETILIDEAISEGKIIFEQKQSFIYAGIINQKSKILIFDTINMKLVSDSEIGNLKDISNIIVYNNNIYVIGNKYENTNVYGVVIKLDKTGKVLNEIQFKASPGISILDEGAKKIYFSYENDPSKVISIDLKFFKIDN